MNLNGIDLNLLLVFDAVMTERSVTRAARRVGLSQPAVSRALSRLRHHLNDDLFVRSPDGMRPTPRALELAGPVRKALLSLEDALDPQAFDPRTASRLFTIVANDYVAGILMPDFVRYLSTEAPDIDLRLLPSTGRALEMLDQQEADFAITPLEDVPSRFGQIELSDARYVILMRAGHPLSKGDLTLERFAEAPHLLFSIRGDAHGFVDDALAKKGLSRRVAMTINQVSVGPALVAASDMVMTAPQQLAERLAPVYGLEVREAPIQGPRLLARIHLIWNKKLAAHPAHDWFRQAIVESARRDKA